MFFPREGGVFTCTIGEPEREEMNTVFYYRRQELALSRYARSYGRVADVHIPNEPLTRCHKGYAFVTWTCCCSPSFVTGGSERGHPVILNRLRV